jgi:uncharacterized membrane protein
VKKRVQKPKEPLTKQVIVRRVIIAALVVVFLIFVGAINHVDKVIMNSRVGQTFERGTVTEVLRDNLQEDGSRTGDQLVKIRMKTGVRKGQEIEATSSNGYLFGAACEPGVNVVVMQSVAGDDTQASVFSLDREIPIYLFALAFIALLCIIGGKQGVKGAIGIVFTFFCILFVYLPLVYRQLSPFWVAVFICILTSVVSLYLIGGPTKKTAVAIGGTVAGVIVSGIAASIFSVATGITGFNVEDIETLLTIQDAADIQIGGLLFSGLLISSLGAVMDVAMSISSAINELYEHKPDISRKELFKAGMHVGRDMMGTDSNTLILAFAGTSLSTLVLDYAYSLPYRQIINSNNIGIEIMQGLSGSFGIILSVPITVLLAVFLLARHRHRDEVPQEMPKIEEK